MDIEFLRWQFEDGRYGVITKNRFKIGVRHIQMVYMLMISITIGMIRGSLGIAVFAVNDQTRINDTHVKVYNWDGRTQGAVLSSFFIGYAALLLPSEIFLRKISGKLICTLILLVNGGLCLAMPTIINKGGWIAACNANLFMGMSHACFFTTNQSLLDKWLPPNERNIFNYIIHGGIQIGIIISLPISGLLSTAPLGWELIYYALAMIGLSMAVISGTLTASSPDTHQAVGDAEKEFIKETMKYYRKKKLNKPWREILKSSRFWAVMCAHAASNTLFVFFLVYGPRYLMTLGIPLKDSSLYCIIPFIAMTIVYIIMNIIINWVYSIKYVYYIFSATFYRKVINFTGSFGIIIGLLILLDFPYKWHFPAVIVLTVILGLLGFQFCGFLTTYRDMSENFSETLITLSCCFSSTFSGALIFIFGVILGDNMCNPSNWRVIFVILASLYLISTTIYTALACNERQYWDRIVDKKHLGHFNGVMDINQVQLEEYGHNYLSNKDENDTAL